MRGGKAKTPDPLWYIAEALRPLAVPIGSIDRLGRNPRTHDEANLKAIAGSLKRFGQRKPLVVNRKNGQVEAGNGTLEAARRLGWEQVAVVFVEDSRTAQDGFAIADNRTAELAGWDEAILQDLLAEMAREAPEDHAELSEVLLLADLLTAAPEPIEAPEPQMDRAEALKRKWRIRTGQLWEIPSKTVKGKFHRVLCGDCFDLDGLHLPQIAALIADPPYASGGLHAGSRRQKVSTKYKHSNSRRTYTDWSGDQKDQRAWTFWCTEWLKAWRRQAIAGAYAMVFVDWRQLPALTDAIQAADWEWRGINVWDKTEGARVAHQGMFRLQAEYVVWASAGNIEVINEQGLEVLPGVFRQSVESKKVHLTQKPVDVLCWCIKIVRKVEGIILDPFLGSGTTLVACEQLGRIGYGIEIEPKYVAVALERLADMGLEPRLIEATGSKPPRGPKAK